MTEANLRPSCPSYQFLHKLGEVCTPEFQEKTAIHFSTLGAIYIVHSSTRHVHKLMKSHLYTYLSSERHLALVLPSSVAESDGLCTQFEEKQLCILVA